MASRTLRFIFDYESPNAYLAWTELPRLEETYGLSLDLVPVLYAGLLDAHGPEISYRGMNNRLALSHSPKS